MTDLDKAVSRTGERLKAQSHHRNLHVLRAQTRQLDTQLFGWRGRLGLRTHHEWLVSDCDFVPEFAAILATMITRHPAAETGWLLATPYGTILIPGHHKRVPKDAAQVQVVRAGLFPLGSQWQPFEDWFALDADGELWANDMGSRALEVMDQKETVARYAAEVLVAARTTNSAD